jgi:hypothetical protein
MAGFNGCNRRAPQPMVERTPMKTLSFAPALMLMLALLVPFTSTLAQEMAQEPPAGQFYLPTPNIPASPYPGEGIEPEVTITETETEVVTEYRIKGKLYMVKIDPLTGPSYYLFDTDGDGTLDREEDSGPNMSVPQWLLFSW